MICCCITKSKQHLLKFTRPFFSSFALIFTPCFLLSLASSIVSLSHSFLSHFSEPRMAAKFISLLCVALLLLCNRPAAYAGRPAPALSSEASATKTPNQGFDAEQTESEMLDDSCSGAAEEECLIRRTLAAHLDYVYTQKHKP